MLNVGTLGAGRIAAVHAKAIAAHAHSTLAAVSAKTSENAARLAADFGATARSTDDILRDPNIDAVLIATSTDTHSDLMERATAAGKAVLCEKPVDMDLARAKACHRAVAQTGQPVMIGFNRRFDPNFAALKTALDTGEVGKAELLTITSFDPAPPPIAYIKTSGSLFRDMMIHDFDMANFTLADGIAALAMAEAAVKSMKTGHPVSLADMI